MDLFSVSSDSLFPISSSQNAQKEQFALRFLNKGLEEYSAGEIDQAIVSFRQAVGFAPQADSAINAYEYIAKSYLTKEDDQQAIQAYQAILRIAPNRDDIHSTIGNIHYANDRANEALASYEQAVRINPSTPNRYSLGQGYLATGQYDNALSQFSLIQQSEPTKPQGALGMGQAYAKMGRYDNAISSLQNAIDLQPDYWDAYVELGYAYMDSGDAEAAREIAGRLEGNDDDLAALLTQYVNETENPQIMAVVPSTVHQAFLSTLGPQTKVSSLSSYLAEAGAGAEQVFALEVLFSKDMDRASVENVLNWDIARTVSTGRADGYNHDLPLPASEVELAKHPFAVYYNSSDNTAAVLFKITQNATADGTIDPSHIRFTFNGTDAKGLQMDRTADSYAGYSGVA